MAVTKQAAVVLCAGAGSRYIGAQGEHKLLAIWRGRPLVSWALGNAVAAGLDFTVVVTGAAQLADVLPKCGVIAVANPDWEEGLATSLQCAIAACRRLGAAAAVVGLGDQPLVPPEAWRAVAACGAAVAVATYGGRRGHPVKLACSVWDDLPASGDEGARALMRRQAELVEEVPCEGDPADFDTAGDFAVRFGSPAR
ncbi:MAG TPA: nucleotidyltransferase family protein [Acidimicrobiales bacterium]|nr:nucleotidyltransferase family protein [Acidimicrobiales bacterium]